MNGATISAICFSTDVGTGSADDDLSGSRRIVLMTSLVTSLAVTSNVSPTNLFHARKKRPELSHGVIWSFMPLTATFIIISFSSPTLSFIPEFKNLLFLQILPTATFLFFFRTDYMIPQTFTITSSTGCFYFLVFLFYNFQLSFPCGRLSRLMSAFKRTLK